MRSTTALTGVGLALALSFLVGCAQAPARGSVALDWSCKLRELQINPTFPPREDIQVGDIYLRTVDTSGDEAGDYCDPANLADFVSIPLHIGTVEGVASALTKYYGTRLNAPRTDQAKVFIQNDEVQVSGFGVPESPDVSVFESKSDKRFRQVGFPDFMSVRVTGAELGAIVPIHGVMSDLGFGIDAVESASISVPVAESYGLPAVTLMSLLDKKQADQRRVFEENDSCRKANGLYATVLGLTYDELKSLAPPPTRRKAATSRPPSADPVLLLTVVREVFATRAIESSIGFKQSFVAGLNRDRSPAAHGGQPRSLPVRQPPKKPDPTASREDELRADTKSLASAVAEVLAARQAVPGITLNVQSSSNHGVGLTRVFDRPVVIGYREISFNIERGSGRNGTCAKVAFTGATSKDLAGTAR